MDFHEIWQQNSVPEGMYASAFRWQSEIDMVVRTHTASINLLSQCVFNEDKGKLKYLEISTVTMLNPMKVN